MEWQRHRHPRTLSRRDPKLHSAADEPAAGAESLDATVGSPMTKPGLPVEAQIHKERDLKKNGGLPSLLTSSIAKKGVR